MQVLGAQNKRKSVQKLQPELPKKSIDRELSSNRTKHKHIDAPDQQIKNYKRKDLNNIIKLQSEKSTLSTEKSFSKLNTQTKHLSSTNTYQQNSIMEASRFLEDHHNTQSLSQLLNSKTKVNSLVNTGRSILKEVNQTQQKKQPKKSIQQSDTQKRDSLEVDDEYEQNSKKKSSYDMQNQSSELYDEDQNFEDYVYGGQKQSNSEKQKKPKIFTKVKTYSVSTHLIKKPQNWRQQNRYQPNTQEQHRMQLQHFNKQREFINLKRQQEEIMKMLQQYRINKKALLQQTNRKNQSKRIMQKFYKQKTLNKIKLQNSQKQRKEMTLTQSSSLPVLKQKKQIIVPQIEELNNQQKEHQNNLIEKRLNIKQKNSSNDYKIKISLSSQKLGFGTKQPRKLYEQQILESQLQNVQKLQKKLREKGVAFNPADIRKSMLNQRVFPNYQESQRTNQTQGQNNYPYKNIFPQKQLNSNPNYKKYPL